MLLRGDLIKPDEALLLLKHIFPFFLALAGLRLSDHRLEFLSTVQYRLLGCSKGNIGSTEVSGMLILRGDCATDRWACTKPSVFRTFYFCPHCVSTEKPFLLKLKRTGWESQHFPSSLMLYPQVTFRGNLPAWGEHGTFASHDGIIHRIYLLLLSWSIQSSEFPSSLSIL